MTSRLNQKNLAQATGKTTLPGYDRAQVTAGIVHLGVGAFQRAHQAVYLDDLLGRDPSWGIIGASLRRPDMRDALAPQNWLYTLAVRDSEGTDCRVIGSLVEVIDGRAEVARLLDIMADPAIRIVTLTVTEKGYCHDPATGALDEAHPDIVHDLSTPDSPRSAPGLIVRALFKRRQAGHAPFTVLSCDNLPSNGKTAGRIISRFAGLVDIEFGNYVAENVRFPSSMVDRIVPATTDEDRHEIASLTGLDDAWPVVTEPFTQWVIEDDFPAGRPAFELAGAELVEDVEPYEHMKLRMLNGSHSTLSYLGYLAGCETVADVIGDGDFRQFIMDMMSKEIMPTLEMDANELAVYRDALIARFSNTALRHRTWQIAMDGSQKLPQRLLGTISDRLQAGEGYERLALGVAGWMRYATGTGENGEAIDVRDPMAGRFSEVAAAAKGDAAALVDGYLRIRDIFGDLGTNAGFREKLVEHVRDLMAHGARAVVRRMAKNQG